MNNTQRWIVVVGALLLVAVAATMAYNAGLSHGISQSGKIVTAPGAQYPYHYGWHRPFGFGFFLFPLFFIALWFFVIRGLFWRGSWHRYGCAPGGFDEWHRRAHERMENSEVDSDRRR